MKYPCLVPKRLCKTNIHVCIEQEGLTKYGDPIPAVELNLKCNYQDSAKTVLTAEQKLVQLAGVALFPGDICPELPTISSGNVNVNGVQRQIFQGMKARNPDSSVNYTELRLI